MRSISSVFSGLETLGNVYRVHAAAASGVPERGNGGGGSTAPPTDADAASNAASTESGCSRGSAATTPSSSETADIVSAGLAEAVQLAQVYTSPQRGINDLKDLNAPAERDQ